MGKIVHKRPVDAPSFIGAMTADANSISNAELADMTRGTVKVGGTSNAPTDLDAKTSGQILVGDATDIASVAVSGDATLSSAGAVTLAETLIKYAAVSIKAAQVKAIRATPIELVAAPAAGKVLEFLSAVLMLDYGSEVFTESSDNLAVKYTNGSGAAASETIESGSFIDAAADTVIKAEAVKDTIMVVAAALVLHNTGDGEIAGNASEDSVLRVKVAYRVHTTGF